MKLSNLDVFLTWDDLKALINSPKQKGFTIHDIRPNGSEVIVEGKALKLGCTVHWSVRIEPMRSDDGRCLVVHVKSFELKEGFARYGFKFFKHFWKFDWSRNSEEFLVETYATKINGARADGNHLLIDLNYLLSSAVKAKKITVQVGKIKLFRSTGDGLRFSIESA